MRCATCPLSLLCLSGFIPNSVSLQFCRVCRKSFVQILDMREADKLPRTARDQLLDPTLYFHHIKNITYRLNCEKRPADAIVATGMDPNTGELVVCSDCNFCGYSASGSLGMRDVRIDLEEEEEHLHEKRERRLLTLKG